MEQRKSNNIAANPHIIVISDAGLKRGSNFAGDSRKGFRGSTSRIGTLTFLESHPSENSDYERLIDEITDCGIIPGVSAPNENREENKFFVNIEIGDMSGNPNDPKIYFYPSDGGPRRQITNANELEEIDNMIIEHIDGTFWPYKNVNSPNSKGKLYVRTLHVFPIENRDPFDERYKNRIPRQIAVAQDVDYPTEEDVPFDC